MRSIRPAGRSGLQARRRPALQAPHEKVVDRMGALVYLDGQLVPEAEAKVSVYDHGLLYGDGVFEGIRAYHGRVFRLPQHLQRLYDSAAGIFLEIPLSMADMEQAVLDTLRANHAHDAYIRLVVTRGVGDLGLDPRKCPRPTVFIIVGKIQLYDPAVYVRGLTLITCETRRTSADALNPAVKSLNYLNNILAKVEVVKAGAEEGIMLNEAGYVAECTGDNIFLVRDQEVVTPPPDAGILKGVTRGAVIEVAEAKGYVVREALFKVEELLAADECFLTGTAAEIAPVTSIDGRQVGQGVAGPITGDLRDGFRELVAREGTPIGAAAS
jgi:branched-chain amino acid aminotransferase